MSCVYVLRSRKDKKLYVGSTRGKVSDRLEKHNCGCVRSTKARRPFELLKHMQFDTYTEAKKKELFFKTTVGRREIKRILETRTRGDGGVVKRTRL